MFEPDSALDEVLSTAQAIQRNTIGESTLRLLTQDLTQGLINLNAWLLEGGTLPAVWHDALDEARTLRHVVHLVRALLDVLDSKRDTGAVHFTGPETSILLSLKSLLGEEELKGARWQRDRKP